MPLGLNRILNHVQRPYADVSQRTTLVKLQRKRIGYAKRLFFFFFRFHGIYLLMPLANKKDHSRRTVFESTSLSHFFLSSLPGISFFFVHAWGRDHLKRDLRGHTRELLDRKESVINACHIGDLDYSHVISSSDYFSENSSFSSPRASARGVGAPESRERFPDVVRLSDEGEGVKAIDPLRSTIVLTCEFRMFPRCMNSSKSIHTASRCIKIQAAPADSYISRRAAHRRRDRARDKYRRIKIIESQHSPVDFSR